MPDTVRSALKIFFILSQACPILFIITYRRERSKELELFHSTQKERPRAAEKSCPILAT